jgi:hypothetical protein
VFVEENQPLIPGPAYQGNWSILKKIEQFGIAQNSN